MSEEVKARAERTLTQHEKWASGNCNCGNAWPCLVYQLAQDVLGLLEGQAMVIAGVTASCEGHKLEQARLREKAEAEVTRLKSEGIVKLCVCVNSDNPAPDCPCVICTVRRVESENARLREALGHLEWLGDKDDQPIGWPSRKLLAELLTEKR